MALTFDVVTAADTANADSTVVKYRDLDISNPQGAAALYGRIHRAAERVCWRPDGDNYMVYRDLKSCIHNTVASAVTAINKPALLAVYNAVNKPPLPVVLTAEQAR